MKTDGGADVDPASHKAPVAGAAVVTDVSELMSWLNGRTPPPPTALRDRVSDLVASAESSGPGAGPELLVAAAERTLRALLARDPRRRECALDLLAADALVTYGFEAAADDPGLIEPLARRAMARLSAVADRA